MKLLPTICSPADLWKLDGKQLRQLSREIREFLIENVTQTGGHLGPNLGIVEITLAVHRIFDSPRDKIIFDTGHQSYVHKLVTGRHNFSTLRQENGLSGYPDRKESEHDILESSHASSSLSWADGLSRALDMQACLDDGQQHYRPYIVAIVGDGALTGGMAWEALNNIAARKDGKIVIIVNDNGRSYAPTIGGMANYLASLRATVDKVRTHRRYELLTTRVKNRLRTSGRIGDLMYRSLRAAKKGVKDWWMPQGMFEDLGLKYVGPVDGHDQRALEEALTRAKNFGAPVIVHTLSEKGHGYAPALAHDADQFHAVGIIDPVTGKAKGESSGKTSWTSIFEDEITKIAESRKDIVGITAAMLEPVGLKEFAARYPDRVIDVGIAEQHAVASAAGMAYAGLHPVVALYSSFLSRAFDQLLMDVALHKAGVTIVLDRAGVTGPDGPSHHGQWDLSLMQIIPGVKVAAPRDGKQLREELREAVTVDDAPTVIRYPKGNVSDDIETLQRTVDGVDILSLTLPERETRDVLIVAVGAMANFSLEVAARLAVEGISAQVVDPRWIFPIPRTLLTLAANHRLVVVVEDAISIGGIGSSLRHEMRQAGVDTAVHEVGLPVEFLAHGSRQQVLTRVGMSVDNVAEGIVAQVHGLKLPYARPLPEKSLMNPTVFYPKGMSSPGTGGPKYLQPKGTGRQKKPSSKEAGAR